MSTISRVSGFAMQYAIQHPLQVVGTYALLANPLTRTWAIRMIAMAGSGALTATRSTAVITAEELVVPVLGSSRVVAGSAIALAAVGGATVGTGISYGIWGEEGARQALTFYGFDAGAGDANYWGSNASPGYFNIPGNTKKIWDHYTNW
tara:strand:- start:34 stop:480 length:447 start_codon:yes stop_codon:yes gene_type:complete